jgi:hypothetical protein
MWWHQHNSRSLLLYTVQTVKKMVDIFIRDRAVKEYPLCWCATSIEKSVYGVIYMHLECNWTWWPYKEHSVIVWEHLEHYFSRQYTWSWTECNEDGSDGKFDKILRELRQCGFLWNLISSGIMKCYCGRLGKMFVNFAISHSMWVLCCGGTSWKVVLALDTVEHLRWLLCSWLWDICTI